MAVHAELETELEASGRPAKIGRRQLEQYLRRNGYPDAILRAVHPLGEIAKEDVKSYGYGRPLQVSFVSRGRQRNVVLRTMSSDPHAHDRRADRAATLLLAHDTFELIPKHVRALDVGMFDEAGNLISLPRGEPFLITEYAEGTLYAVDLEAASKLRQARALDLARAELLARYLVSLHRAPAAPPSYLRAARDLVGHGEGIFGVIDNYPSVSAGEGATQAGSETSASRLRAIELETVRWRWKLREYTHRARRTHGDFHPFNLLFRERLELSVLDCSRGACGDPADDVTCLSINYLFFALRSGDSAFKGSLREIWSTFWRTYLMETRDRELLEVAAPFFTWRALVLASPVWYPHVDGSVRDALLTFAERLLAGARFDPETVEGLLS